MNKNNRSSLRFGFVLALMVGGALGIAPTSAHAAAQLVINTLDVPTSGAPGEILTGTLSISNTGTTTGFVNFVNIRSADFTADNFHSGSNRFPSPSVEVAVGGTVNIPAGVALGFASVPGATQQIDVNISGFEAGTFSSISASKADVLRVTVTAVRIDLRLLSVRSNVTSVSIADTLFGEYDIDYSTPHPGYRQASAQVLIKLSTDTVLDSSDTTIENSFPSLSPTLAQTVSFSFPFPSSVNPGSYFLIAEIQPDSSRPETTSSNNRAVSASPVQVTSSAFDLVFESVAAAPSATSAGSLLGTSYAVRLDGPSGDNRSFSVGVDLKLSLDQTPDDQDIFLDSDFFSISRGQRFGRPQSSRIPSTLATGSYFLIGRVDPPSFGSPFGSLRESNEQNNTFVRTPALSISGTPVDLRLLSVAAQVSTTAQLSTLPVTFSAIYEAPDAGFPFQSMQVDFYLSRDGRRAGAAYLTSAFPGSFAPGQTFGLSRSVSLPASVEPGSYKIVGVLDPNDSVKERNEGNNELGSGGVVGVTTSPVDFVLESVSSLTSTTSVTSQLVVSFTVVHNAPAGFSGRSIPVEFMLSRDRQVDASDQLLTSASSFFLNPGERFSGTATKFPPILADPGPYFLIGIADADKNTPEANEQNNVFVSANAVTLFRPPDDHADSPIDVQIPRDLLPNGTRLEAGIDFPRDIDVFAIQAIEGVPVNLVVDAPFFCRVTLFDQDGRRQLFQETGFGSTPIRRNYLPIFASGTYYVRVEHGSNNDIGRYQIFAEGVRADLRPLSLAIPSVASLADSLPVTVAIAMTSPQTNLPQLEVATTFYLSPNRALDRALDIPIGTASSFLTTGQPVVTSRMFPLGGIANLKPGNFFVIADVDGNDAFQETNELNNVFVSSSTVQIGDSGLDVRIADFRFLKQPVSAAPSFLMQTTLTVQITGSASPPGTRFNVLNRFLLSTDRVPDDFDVFVEQASMAIVAGGSSGGPRSFLVPTGVRPGQYFLLCETDYTGQVRESASAEGNNVQALGPFAVGPVAVDLSMTSVAAESRTVSAGGMVPVSVSAFYSAPTTDFGSLGVRFEAFLTRDPEGKLGRVDLSIPSPLFGVNMGPNSGFAGQGQYTFSAPGGVTPGTYFLRAKISSTNGIPETTLANNVVADPLPLTVTAGSKDIRLLDFTSPLTVTSALGLVPVTITLQIDDPGAMGTFQDSLSYRVLLSTSSTLGAGTQRELLSSFAYPLVNEPRIEQRQVAIQSDQAPGNYFLIVELNSNRGIAETTRANNVASIPITVVPGGIDLRFVNVQLLEPGESVGDSLAVSASARYEAPNRNFQSIYTRVTGWLSQDNSLQKGTDLKLNYTFTELVPNETRTEQLSLTIPASVVPGSYFVIGELDEFNSFKETNELNNVLASTQTASIFSAQTDFALLAMRSTRDALLPAETVPLTATVAYFAPSIGYPLRTVTLEACLSADSIFDKDSDRTMGQTSFNLSAGQVQDVAIRAFIPGAVPPGTYFIIGVLDRAGQLPDFNRANNALASQPVSMGSPVVDLNVLGVSFSPATTFALNELATTVTMSYSVPDVSRFDPIPVSADIFLEKSPAINIYSPSPREYRSVTVIPNQTMVFQFPVNVGGMTPGQYFLGVAADRSGVLGEQNKFNNLRFAADPLTLTTPPTIDFSLGAFSVTTPAVKSGVSFSVPVAISLTTPELDSDHTAFVSLYLSESGLLTDTVRSIGTRFFFDVAGGQTTTGTVSCSVARNQAAGTYFVVGVVSPSGRVDGNPANDRVRSSNTVTVVAPTSNRPPVAKAGPDRILALGRFINLEGLASDADGDSTTVRWSEVTSTGVLGSATTSSTRLRLQPGALGNFTLRLTATDPFGATGSDDVVVSVRNASELGPIIDTVIGPVEASGSSSEGEAALRTYISGPDDVGLDAQGSLYYAEGSSNRVRKMDAATRTVRTIAGPAHNSSASSSGSNSPFTPGFSGDNGLAVDARFARPEGLSVVGVDDILIADTFNHRIRRVSGGTVQTVAGGLLLDPFNASGYAGDGQLATNAALNKPHQAIRQASTGDLFIADTGNHAVRRVAFSSGIITTVAGRGFPGSSGDGGLATQALLNFPTRLAFDSQGGLLICEDQGHRVRRIDPATGRISTLAGTGQPGFSGDAGLAKDAQLFGPDGVALDSAAFGYVSDSNNHRIRRIAPTPRVISSLAGNGTAADFGDGGPAAISQVCDPVGMAVDGQRNIFFGTGTGKIRTIGASTAPAAIAPAMVLKPSDSSGSFSVANDTDLGTPGIQVTVSYSGLQDANGSTVSDKLLELVVTPTAGGATVTYTATVVSGNVTFTNVNLTAATVYDFAVRDPSTGQELTRQRVTEGRAPQAVVRPILADNAGPQLVRLDATGSFDPDPGDTLTYKWEILRPPTPANVATLSSADEAASLLRYRANASGTYAFRLTVTDRTGRTSVAQVQFSVKNVPPLAEPGLPQQFLLPNPASTIPANRTTTVAVLDGRASQDANGDPFTYRWRLVKRPASAVALNRTTSPVILEPNAPATRVQFSADRSTDGRVLDSGAYVFSLTVTDPLGDSSTRLVEVRALDPRNVIPNANAGLDRAVVITRVSTGSLDVVRDIPDPLDPKKPVQFIRLDGRESADSPPPGGLPRRLTYQWTVTSAPAGSNVTSPLFPNLADTPLAQFVPDLAGTYRFQLVVNNTQFDSSPDTVDIDVSIRDSNATPSAEFRVRDTARGRISSFATPVLTFTVGDIVTLDGSFSTDRDDPNQLTYQWTQISGDRVALAPSESTSQPAFQPTTAGSYDFELVVTDPKGSKSRPALGRAVVLAEGDRLPVLSLRASATSTTAQGVDFGDEVTEGTTSSLRVTLPTTVTLTAIVVDPEVQANTQRLNYGFQQVAGPTVALTTGAVNTVSLQSQVQFTPTTSRVHVFQCTVEQLDATGKPTGVQVRRFIRVIVNSLTNSVPVARARVLPNKTSIGLCEPVRLDGSNSEDSGPNSTASVLYRWTQVAGPQIVLSNPFSSLTTFVAPDLGSDDPREVVFALVVDDGNDQSDPFNVSITLDPTTTQTVSLPLRRGLDLVSVAVTPGTSYTAADLSALTSSPIVIRTFQGEDGSMQFQAWHSALNLAPFAIQGNEGYLVSSRRSAITVPVTGRAWPGTGLARALGQGTNLVAYPRGAPSNETAEKLRDRAGASFVVRFDATTGKFDVYLPGLTTTPFAIERGRAYLMSVPSSRTLSLPTCAE
ncbi:MAG: hypothetical protein HY816_00175 [Candidatus Wallbacteria bacterium]|nr:hypothetical protein [Candidatus Wallbacteria bacterium]